MRAHAPSLRGSIWNLVAMLSIMQRMPSKRFAILGPSRFRLPCTVNTHANFVLLAREIWLPERDLNLRFFYSTDYISWASVRRAPSRPRFPERRFFVFCPPRKRMDLVSKIANGCCEKWTWKKNTLVLYVFIHLCFIITVRVLYVYVYSVQQGITCSTRKSLRLSKTYCITLYNVHV